MILNIILAVIAAPVLVLEYFALTWCWFGGTSVNIAAVPAIFIFYALLSNFLCKKLFKNGINVPLVLLIAIVLPVLTIITLEVVAPVLVLMFLLHSKRLFQKEEPFCRLFFNYAIHAAHIGS